MRTLERTRDHSHDASSPGRPPFLFLMLESHQPLAPAARFALAPTAEVVFRRGDARDVDEQPGAPGRRLSLALADPWLSSTHATLRAEDGAWILRDEGSRNGTSVNGARINEVQLADGDLLEVGKTLFLFRAALEAPPGAGDLTSDVAARPDGLFSLIPALAERYEVLERAAAGNVSIVLFGETGTGKEVLARALHRMSGRPGDLVAVNCGALPATLLESELFGHVKGAFSGATQDRPGLVRSAHRGTLFLDEIGDLPAASQAAFLRVLQEREVVPVGASRAIPVDLRLISASHMNVEAMAAEGKRFRSDLWARLAGLKVSLPPLRQRREDLGWLIGHLIQKLAGGRAASVRFKLRAATALLGHDWPLNVRGLEKALDAALAVAGDEPIALKHLGESILRPPAAPTAPQRPAPAPELAVPEADDTLPFSAEDMELREQILGLLAEHRGSLAAVARAMGKARIQIQRWLKRFDIDAANYRR